MLSKSISLALLGILTLSAVSCKERRFSEGTETSSTPGNGPAAAPATEPATVLDVERAVELANENLSRSIRASAAFLMNDFEAAQIVKASLEPFLQSIVPENVSAQFGSLEIPRRLSNSKTQFKFNVYLLSRPHFRSFDRVVEFQLDSPDRRNATTLAEFRLRIAEVVRALVRSYDAELMKEHETLVGRELLRPEVGQRYTTLANEAAVRLLADEATRARVPMNWQTIGEFSEPFANLGNNELRTEILRTCNTATLRTEAERRNAGQRAGSINVTPADVLVERLNEMREMADRIGKTQEFATLLERVSRLVPKR